MGDPKEQRKSVGQRESIELDLEAETVTDLEPKEIADAVRGGSDHPMCTIPGRARL